MNFYIGNSADEVKEQDCNVEFSDELIDFIYKLNKKVSFDMQRLCEINPYDDAEISKNDVKQIISICKHILDNNLLYDYDEPTKGNQMLKDLAELSQKALLKGLGLISVGD